MSPSTGAGPAARRPSAMISQMRCAVWIFDARAARAWARLRADLPVAQGDHDSAIPGDSRGAKSSYRCGCYSCVHPRKDAQRSSTVLCTSASRTITPDPGKRPWRCLSVCSAHVVPEVCDGIDRRRHGKCGQQHVAHCWLSITLDQCSLAHAIETSWRESALARVARLAGFSIRSESRTRRGGVD